MTAPGFISMYPGEVEWMGSLQNVTAHERRVIVFRFTAINVIVARTLEGDFCTHGKSVGEALTKLEQRIETTSVGETTTEEPVNIPDYIEDLWENGPYQHA